MGVLRFGFILEPHENLSSLKGFHSAIRRIELPRAIGFGISTHEQAKKTAAISDGAIMGSAIIKLLEKYGRDAPPYAIRALGESNQSHRDSTPTQSE